MGIFPIKIVCGHRSTSIEIPLQKLSLHFHNFIISSRPNLDIISAANGNWQGASVQSSLLVSTTHNMVERVDWEKGEGEDIVENNSTNNS